MNNVPKDENNQFEVRMPKAFFSLVNLRWGWTVVFLLLVHTGLLAYSGYVHSPTLNEPAHLAAGISHWQLGDFSLYRVNPPLVRMVTALPVLVVGAKTDWSRLHQDRTVRTDFVVGDDLISANDERSFFLFMIARWVCIPFAWVGGIVCFLWARDLFGSPAGILASILWCFSPNILAHSSLITPDAPATALFVAASYLFWKWLCNPTWEQAILAGILLGLAELAKTTFVVLYLLLPLLWIFYQSFGRTKRNVRSWGKEGVMLLACLTSGILITNIGYGLNGSLTRLGEFQFTSNMLKGPSTENMGNRFTDTWLGNIPVPFPKDYVIGIDVQRRDFEHFGRPSYLAGEFQDTGWWYYYLYALAIKVPLGIWGLLLLTVVLRLAKQNPRISPYSLRDEMVLLLPAIFILVLVSSQTGFSEHLRYVLPIFPLVFIWISQVAQMGVTRIRSFVSSRKRVIPGLWQPALAGSLLVWFLGSSLWVYPHNLAYFNELVGGPSGGHAHLLGSNVDWGQDLRYLKWWLDEHPEVDSLHLAYCGRCDPTCLGISYSAPPPSISATEQMPKLQPGWYAVSVNFLRGYPWFAPDGQGGCVVYERNALSYFLEMSPTAVVGASIYVFKV